MGDPRPIAVLPLRPSWYLAKLVDNETQTCPKNTNRTMLPSHIGFAIRRLQAGGLD